MNSIPSFMTWHSYNRTLTGYTNTSEKSYKVAIQGSDLGYLGQTGVTFTVIVKERAYLAPGIIMIFAAVAALLLTLAFVVHVCVTVNYE